MGICGNGVRTHSTDATAQMYGLGKRAQLAAHQNIRRGLKEPAVGGGGEGGGTSGAIFVFQTPFTPSLFPVIYPTLPSLLPAFPPL